MPVMIKMITEMEEAGHSFEDICTAVEAYCIRKHTFFVLDNLDAAIEYEKTSKENQGQPWSIEHDQHLRDLYQKNIPIKEIAVTLKRNSGAIRARLKKLGITE